MTDSTSVDVIDSTSQTALKSYVERIERIEEDMTAVKEDRKSIYDSLKGDGFDAKIVRKIIRARKQSKAARQEEESLFDLYSAAIGGL